MHSFVHVGSCHEGVVHLSIGAVTIRLDQESFQLVAQEVFKRAQEMVEATATKRLTLLKGALS